MDKESLEKFWKKFKTKWSDTSAVVLGVASLLYAGYAGGKYLSSIECEREKLTIVGDYQERLSEQINSCNYNKIDDLSKKTNALEITVEQLKNTNHEK